VAVIDRPRNVWRQGTHERERTTLRYHGSGVRGAPPAHAVDDSDLSLVIRELERARLELAAAHQVQGRVARGRALREAVGRVAWCGRLLDEVIERRGGAADPDEP
jgi:hypothetical protein